MSSKITVGMVEDNKVIRENVTKYIGFAEDMEVSHSVSSVEALLSYIELNSNFSPHILLLDIGLPGMSGLEGISLIKEKMPDTDIVMLTTFEEEEKILTALCSGASAYISKKTSLKTILEGIRIVHDGGSYMSPEIAREIFSYLVRSNTTKVPETKKSSLLTDRQNEILEKLADGKSYKEIAELLFISPETVRTHIKKIYKTLHVNNKAEAIAKYLKGELK